MSKFKPGESGNPAGKKPGSGHRQKLFSALINPHKEELVSTAITMALNGNESMLRLLLERLLPAKPNDEPITPVDIQNMKISEQGNTIVSLIASGELSPLEGNSLLQALTSQARLIESDDLLKRIEALEKK